jgi:hypothetical protein
MNGPALIVAVAGGVWLLTMTTVALISRQRPAYRGKHRDWRYTR